MGLGGDNFIDDELSLEHSSMSPKNVQNMMRRLAGVGG
jgi:hypothetical protein